MCSGELQKEAGAVLIEVERRAVPSGALFVNTAQAESLREPPRVDFARQVFVRGAAPRVERNAVRVVARFSDTAARFCVKQVLDLASGRDRASRWRARGRQFAWYPGAWIREIARMGNCSLPS
jgi:hypothetical protein